ncbi:MAG: hypothetical protein PF637_02140 [Spirochaetes bacterium]|jgi:hypothetical protein|nr:hypothetical protein [Spirochaetota bacterium]
MLEYTLLSPAVMIGIVIALGLFGATIASFIHDNWKPRDPYHRH